MSAAVATRASQRRTSPHLSSSSATSRMGTNSPVDTKKNHLSKPQDNLKKESQAAAGKGATPPRSEPTSRATESADASTTSAVNKSSTNATSFNAAGSQPLAPPPRPTQHHNTSETPDYFSGANGGTHFSLEPNPFEQSFGQPSSETPGKSLLPPVAALTSPASLLQGGGSSAGFNWPNSLRSGPLSPAMLTGPTGSSNDYFDSHLRGSFPTPNESSLRTGLTPGGGGSMFPAPSPNSSAIYQQLASGGATPSTLEFHRTALNFANHRRNDPNNNNNNNEGGDQPDAVAAAAAAAASQAAQQNGGNVDANIKQESHAQPAQTLQTRHQQHQQQQQQQQQQNQQHQQSQQQMPPNASQVDPFGQHDANDAANGLFLLAQQNVTGGQNQFAAANNQSNSAQAAIGNQMGGQPQGTSPRMAKRGGQQGVGSIGGSLSGSARGMSEMSGELDDSDTKPSTRGKGKKGGAKNVPSTNGRRKADETPSKAPPAKKGKNNHGSVMPDFSIDSDEDADDMKDNGLTESGRKMTDEEKRKNFLERNRVAALKCRQRKKQWLANLQHKVELFGSENDALSGQVTQLREEVVNLKTLLLAHKDCPVAQAQGIQGLVMNGGGGPGGGGGGGMQVDYNHHANPYGMAMGQQQAMAAGQGMQQRRYPPPPSGPAQGQ